MRLLACLEWSGMGNAISYIAVKLNNMQLSPQIVKSSLQIAFQMIICILSELWSVSS